MRGGPKVRTRRRYIVPVIAGALWIAVMLVVLSVLLTPVDRPHDRFELPGSPLAVVSIDGREYATPVPHVAFLGNLSIVDVATTCGDVRLRYVTDTDGDGITIWFEGDRGTQAMQCMERDHPALLRALVGTKTWQVLSGDTIELMGDARLILRR